MKLGGIDIADVKIGDTQVDKVYQGGNLVWQYVPPVPFEFTVKTDNAGVSGTNEFRMPLTTSTGLNIKVDWGDFSPIETITNHTLAIHTYAAAGTYTIKVLGSLLGWQFNNGGDRLKMLNVSSWGALNISVDNGFNGCTNLTCTATDAPLITDNGISTSLSSYFANCSNFNGDINNWDVSKVRIMNGMFSSCINFNKDLNNWNTSNVTNMSAMFFVCRNFNGEIGNWDTQNVITFENMFRTDTGVFNRYIGNWNTSKALNMAGMFQRQPIFNQDINTKIVNMGLPNQYTAWDTSKVLRMDNMFFLATAFDKNIGGWDVSNVTGTSISAGFYSMFGGATSFNNGGSADINNWTFTTSSNITMAFMFGNATAFNQNIGSWDISNVTDFSNFMLGKTAANYDAANLDSIYNGWSSLPSVQPNLSISFGSIKYTAAGQAGKDILTNTYGWTITDGGVINEAEYQAVLDYATTQTYTLPTISQRNQQNLLLYNLKQDGIWSKLDTFAVFATDGDSDFALIDWKKLSQYTAVNSPTFTTNAGFNGNATSSYIDSNFNPLSDSLYMQTNDASFGMYIKTAGTITGRGHGNFNTANGAGIYFNPNGTGAVRIWMNSGGVFSGSNLNRVGFYQIDRSSSLNINYIKNGVQIENTTIDSTFRPDGNLYFLASLIASSAGDFNDDQLSLVYAGSSLNSEKANFNNAVNTYITSL